MAAPDRAPASNKDLESIAQARALAVAAKQAQAQIAELSQEQIDAIVTAMADAITPHAEALAKLAVEETGYGVVADKVQKNLFSSRQVYEFIKPMRTVGVVNRIEAKKLIEIGEPFGVVAGVVPSTNPTSTAIYKVLIALKARCAIVLSPHPRAHKCTCQTAAVLYQYGTGPVKGFAVTLIAGIVASLVTSIFVVRTFYLLWLNRARGAQTLSI